VRRISRAWKPSRAISTTPRSNSGPDAYVGKKTVVIGSNNSAHDIAAALWEAGADVTMVQRSTTHIVKSDTLMEIGLGSLFGKAVQDGMTTARQILPLPPCPTRSCTNPRSRLTLR
jgi:hypothetical protein